MTTSSINHLAYPHIIDRVWAHMSYPALVAASQTCRAWRQRSVPLLAHHISVRRGRGRGPDCELIVCSRNLCFPKLSAEIARGTVRFWRLGMRAPLPRQRWYLVPEHLGPNPQRSHWIGVFKHTRIVDWLGFRSLALDHVGILPAMLRNRPAGTPEPVWRLFDNFTPGETLGEALDWVPAVIFCDVDAGRGLAVPGRGAPGLMLAHEPRSKASRPEHDIVLHMRCMPNPCDGLLAFEEPSQCGQSEPCFSVIVQATGVQVPSERISALIGKLKFRAGCLFGLDTLLASDCSWDELLLAVEGVVQRDAMFLFDHVSGFESAADYVAAAWQDTRKQWGRLRDYETLFADKFLIHTMR